MQRHKVILVWEISSHKDLRRLCSIRVLWKDYIRPSFYSIQLVDSFSTFSLEIQDFLEAIDSHNLAREGV